MKKFIKSEAEDQFEVDEKLVDEIANSDEFKDVEITNDDVMDALQAIDALADAVIEKADVEEKKLDADQLLDEVRDMIDETHESEEELEEGEELPEELTNSAVRVMVSEDGAVSLEQTPDEVYDSEIDGMECTMFDTCDIPPVEIDETGATDDATDEDVLVIGNSKAKNFKKGFMKLASSANKKAWSAAYKKVKKMIKNAKMTAAHWAIVSAIAKKEEEQDELKKKIECALLKKIRSNAALKSRLLKSSDEINPEGQPEAETKPEETVGEGNPGYEEVGEPTEAKSPEQVDSQSGNPVTDPDKEVETESEQVVLPEGEMIVLEVPLTNSKKKITLKKVHSSARKQFNAYKAKNVDSALAHALDGKVVKSGKLGFVFKDTANGLLACAAKFVDSGKGTYGTVLKNDKVVVARGEFAPVFNSVERFMNAKALISARKESVSEGKKALRSMAERRSELFSKIRARKNALNSTAKKPVEKEALESRRDAIRSRIEAVKARRDAIRSRKESIRSRIEAREQVKRERLLASQNEAKLRKMHADEERKRLFQNSQAVMNEEKIAIKQGASRNSAALSAMYDNMF